MNREEERAIWALRAIAHRYHSWQRNLAAGSPPQAGRPVNAGMPPGAMGWAMADDATRALAELGIYYPPIRLYTDAEIRDGAGIGQEASPPAHP